MSERFDVVPTRSVLRELEAEHRMVREGREFLDQKRMLLAAEIVRRLERYERERRELDALERRAVSALVQASARHGLEGLLCQPAVLARESELLVEEQSFLGLVLVDARLEWRAAERDPPSANPSVEARRLRRWYRALIERAAALAAQSSTLLRLAREYRQTERRTRALEDVLEPELSSTVNRVRDELDEQDLEEAVHARRSAGASAFGR